jgi:hypothetical protein
MKFYRIFTLAVLCTTLFAAFEAQGGVYDSNSNQIQQAKGT